MLETQKPNTMHWASENDKNFIAELISGKKNKRLIWDGYLPNGKKKQYWENKDIDWELHLTGQLKQGGNLCFEIDGKKYAKAAVVDVDQKVDAKEICSEVFSLDPKAVPIKSPSGRWHIWMFFSKPVAVTAAAKAKLKGGGADANALIKPITDLAAFMGTTATEAANSFGRAFAGGAGAADILRERGILNIIKTSQGLSDLSNTTLPKFREALINTLQDPVIGIEGSTDRLSRTFTGAFSNMQDSVTRFTAEVGDKALPKLTSLTRATTSFFNKITSGFRRAFGTEAANMLENLKALNVEASLLKDLQILVFQEETQKQVAKVNEEIGKLLAKNKRLRDTFLEFGTGDVNVKRLQKTTIALSETFDNVSISTDKAKDLIQVLKQQLNLTRINAKELAEEFNNTGNISESASAKLSNQSVALLSLIAALQQTVNLSEDLKNKIAELSVNSEQVTVTFTK